MWVYDGQFNYSIYLVVESVGSRSYRVRRDTPTAKEIIVTLTDVPSHQTIMYDKKKNRIVNIAACLQIIAEYKALEE